MNRTTPEEAKLIVANIELIAKKRAKLRRDALALKARDDNWNQTRNRG